MSANSPKDPSPRSEQDHKSSPRWSEIEDNILKQAVARYGVSRWDDVAKMIWTKKSAEDCRARWAELVPLLHDVLARQEYDRKQQQRRQRSMTVSASGSEASQRQDATDFQPLPPPILEQQTRGLPAEEEAAQSRARARPKTKSYTEPPSPDPQTLSATKPPLSSLAAVLPERIRRNTEPGARPADTTASPRAKERPQQQQHEWLAPHPLMPGRPRNPSVSSRNTSTSSNKDANT
ncbi:hypothetical protein F4804DRAFT_303810 [Jackrogersella minutella]|nr:hypothetical protein F4804DRAFT_303810 [Jackrogersella minutella]